MRVCVCACIHARAAEEGGRGAERRVCVRAISSNMLDGAQSAGPRWRLQEGTWLPAGTSGRRSVGGAVAMATGRRVARGCPLAPLGETYDARKDPKRAGLDAFRARLVLARARLACARTQTHAACARGLTCGSTVMEWKPRRAGICVKNPALAP